MQYMANAQSLWLMQCTKSPQVCDWLSPSTNFISFTLGPWLHTSNPISSLGFRNDMHYSPQCMQGQL